MKNRKILIWTLIFILSIVVLLDYTKYRALRVNQLELNIEEIIEDNLNNNKEMIDMKVLLPFEWEKIYIFEPYTPYKDICTAIGFKYTTARNFIKYKFNKTNTGLYYDNLKKIVFVKNNKVIYDTNYNSHLFDFNKNYYTYEESVFTVIQNNGSYILQSNSY